MHNINDVRLDQRSQNFFARGPHELLQDNSRAGHHSFTAKMFWFKPGDLND